MARALQYAFSAPRYSIEKKNKAAFFIMENSGGKSANSPKGRKPFTGVFIV
jgi:hypothetical protein